MKSAIKPILVTSIILSSTFAIASTNSSLSCGKTDIKLGLLKHKITNACGVPFSEFNRKNKNYVKYKTLEGKVQTETKLKFINDKLVSINYEQEDEGQDI